MGFSGRRKREGGQYMAVAVDELQILEKLDRAEMEKVMSFASSLIRSRQGHKDDYYRFQEIRDKMTKKNPMSMEEIDRIIHSEA